MSELRERVARAIASADLGLPHDYPDYYVYADAAINAWPGMKLEHLSSWVMDGPDLPYVEEVASIILPLTESGNE